MMNHLFNKSLKHHVEKGTKFVLFADNYFTFRKTIELFRNHGVGIVGTARPKHNWPPKELKVPDDAFFNLSLIHISSPRDA